MKHLYAIFFLLIVLPISNLSGQVKEWKNRYAYKADQSIYSFETYDSTQRSQHCRAIIMNQKKEAKFGEPWELDWTVEKEELLKSGGLIEVENQFLSFDRVSDEVGEFMMGTRAGFMLGPYQSDYGQFRFIEIDFNSQVLSSSSGMSYNWWALDKKKGKTKALLKIADAYLDYYKFGIGEIEALDKKYRRFKTDKRISMDFVDERSTRKRIETTPAGEYFWVLENEAHVILFFLRKKDRKNPYIYYNEYIFK